MESGGIKELSRYRFEKTLFNIALARTLYQSQDYGVALNRAYYSAFDAMRAVNALDGFDSSKHSGVISHFNQTYVKTGCFAPSASAVIRKASMLREKSDYEDFYMPEEEDAVDTIAKVELFLQDVKAYLTKRGIIESK